MTPEPSPSPTQLIIPSPGAVTWDVVAQWVTIGILIACTVAVIFFVFNYLPKVKKIKPFYASIAAVAILGGVFAFLLPVAFNSGFGKDDDGRVLRQLILYTTGGLLGVITLGETHRKNNQEKEKNENDHTRQVYAERRSRYTKAVEQLANEKATVRLGGIYTLVGLVDEWLADDTLKSEEQQKEGQVIINNLCSYIRSPFPLAAKIEEYEAHKELEKLQKTESEKLSEGESSGLQVLLRRLKDSGEYEAHKELEKLQKTESEKLREAESSRLQVLLRRFKDSDEYKKPKDITTDYAKFHEEQDVRRTIFVEMSKRSSTFTMNEQDEIIETISGTWSDFDFDFSRAPIFYPLSSLTIEKGNFSSAKFYSDADFSEAAFTQTADFSEATFTQDVVFSWAKFTKHASFSGATFTKYVYFFQARFTQDAVFSWARFTQDADFSEATFTQTADFNRATFTQTADFNRARFTQDADFSEATFTQTADFSEATFSASSPKFIETSKVKFVETSEVKYVLIPKVLGMTFRARFATLPEYQTSYDFTVSEGSFPILLGEAELGDGAKYHIPVGTVLFDPDSWDEEKQEYTRVSEPAEPLDNSSAGEENITE